MLWRKGQAANLRDGFSSIAVSEGRVFTIVKRYIDGGYREVCVALNADNGAEQWATPLGLAKYDGGGESGAEGNDGGDGPRSTPTVRGDRVYVFTAWLVIACLDATDGHVVWSKDLMAAPYNAPIIAWENAASPVIENGLVLVNGNVISKRLMAFRASDGELAWSGQNDKMTHSTPVSAVLGDVRQTIFYAQSGLVSVNPTNGVVLWRHACSYNGTSVAASPVVAGDLVFCSAGYNTGARVVRISKSGSTFSSSEVKRTYGQFESHWATPVHHNGYLYGVFGTKEYGTAPLKCVKLDTLEEQWSQDNFGPGGVLLVNDKLLVLTDTGILVVVEPDPSGYREVSRFTALTGKCWNVPAVTDGRIYARGTKEIVALDVAVPPPPPLRLESPVFVSGAKVQIRFRNADGTGVDSARVNDIEVRASTEPMLPITDWTVLSGLLGWEDGTVLIEEDATVWTRRFFRAVENH